MHSMAYFNRTRPHTAREHVHAQVNLTSCGVCLAAPLGDQNFETMPRPFDLFASMKSSDVGGIVELRKMYLCCGYVYSFDLHQSGEGCALQDLIKPTSCSLLGVQLKCFGSGFSRKTVESIGARGKAALEEDGIPITAVDLSTTDTFRVHRIAGLFTHACTPQHTLQSKHHANTHACSQL